jgi:hypothetical protein
MRRTGVTTLALLLVLTGTVALALEKRWVSSEGTTLKKEAAISSEDLMPLPVGSELSVIESGGRWVKVKTANDTEGWVYAGRIVDAPPAAEVGGDGGLFGGTMQQSQVETAKADSARSIRGLSPETDQYATQRGTPEALKKALDKVLTRKVSKTELKTFLREGKIGEYAP